MTDGEVHYIADAIEGIIEKNKEWSKDYLYNSKNNEFESVLGEEELHKELNKVYEV